MAVNRRFTAILLGGKGASSSAASRQLPLKGKLGLPFGRRVDKERFFALLGMTGGAFAFPLRGRCRPQTAKVVHAKWERVL